MSEIEIKAWPGYAGEFSRQHAEGAIPNGTLIFSKVGHVAGIVLGSVDGMEVDKELCERKNVRFGYWIEWNDWPRTAYFVIDRKIKVGKKTNDAAVAQPQEQAVAP